MTRFYIVISTAGTDCGEHHRTIAPLIEHAVNSQLRSVAFTSLAEIEYYATVVHPSVGAASSGGVRWSRSRKLLIWSSLPHGTWLRGPDTVRSGLLLDHFLYWLDTVGNRPAKSEDDSNLLGDCLQRAREALQAPERLTNVTLVQPSVATSPVAQELQTVRMYRTKGNVTEFWQVWWHGGSVFRQTAKLGKRAKIDYIGSFPDTTGASAQFQQDIAAATAAGFAVLDESDMARLNLSFDTGVEISTTDAMDFGERIVDLLDEELANTGLGLCDGVQVGSGSIDLLCLVADAALGQAVIEEALRKRVTGGVVFSVEAIPSQP
jgi:hypothetical protein